MKKINQLNHLEEGQSACVRALTLHGAIRRRLQDIGLIQGTKVKCLRKSPLGDPVAYSVCGAVIAIRTVDASRVLVEDVVWD